MNDEQLPNSDPDLKLARKIGQGRTSGTSIAPSEDPIMKPLLDHRKRIHTQHASNDTGKQQVWQAIADQTSSSSQSTSIRQLFPAQAYRWAAAAVLVIGALFTVFYTQFWQQPELVARSLASIETVQLIDGSSVTLRPHSKLYKVEQSKSVLLYKLKGEAFFKVTPKQHRPFSVKTQNGRISVLGTQFVLSSWGPEMRVFLLEGSVKVQSLQSDEAITLQPGEAASVGSSGDISHTTNANKQVFTDWLHQQLIFNSKPAGQIAAELEQQFNITISLPASISNNRLSGQLSIKNLNTSLQDLAMVLGGTFVQVDEHSYRFEAK